MNNNVTITQELIVQSAPIDNEHAFAWLEAKPDWRVSFSFKDFSYMDTGKVSMRMTTETLETLFLSVVQKALNMKLSVLVDVEWEKEHSPAFYEELYSLANAVGANVRVLDGLPEWKSPEPIGRAYQPNPDLPKAVWVDVDGTLAKMADRSPFDWNRVGEDEPINHVIDVVKALKADGYKIVILSGRDSICEEQTGYWLRTHGIEYDAIHMRAIGDDKTPDNILKHDLYWTHVADKFDIRFALDDRQKVVNFTRDVLKIPVFQVAPGDF